MAAEDDFNQRWLKLEENMSERLGKKPDLQSILLFIGIKEAGLPPKQFTETEKYNLIEMAECTVLVPGRYYQLFWVEDSGWPHFQQLERVPQMSAEEKEVFFKPFILMYAEKNRLM